MAEKLRDKMIILNIQNPLVSNHPPDASLVRIKLINLPNIKGLKKLLVVTLVSLKQKRMSLTEVRLKTQKSIQNRLPLFKFLKKVAKLLEKKSLSQNNRMKTTLR